MDPFPNAMLFQVVHKQEIKKKRSSATWMSWIYSDVILGQWFPTHPPPGSLVVFLGACEPLTSHSSPPQAFCTLVGVWSRKAVKGCRVEERRLWEPSAEKGHRGTRGPCSAESLRDRFTAGTYRGLVPAYTRPHHLQCPARGFGGRGGGGVLAVLRLQKVGKHCPRPSPSTATLGLVGRWDDFGLKVGGLTWHAFGVVWTGMWTQERLQGVSDTFHLLHFTVLHLSETEDFAIWRTDLQGANIQKNPHPCCSFQKQSLPFWPLISYEAAFYWIRPLVHLSHYCPLGLATLFHSIFHLTTVWLEIAGDWTWDLSHAK